MYYTQPMYPPPTMTAFVLNNNRNIIEVSGEGTVTAAPDQAVIVLGAITENVSLSTAQRENAATMSKIINSLLQLNIPNQNIQTVNFRIDMQYDYEDGKPILRGYRVTHLLQVTIHNVEQTGIVVDTAVSNGANSVSNIQFTMAHPEIYYNRALSLAVNNAEDKAETITRTLGVTLIRNPIKVEEEARRPEPPVPFQAALLAEAAATPIQPGQLKISASIRAQYCFI